MWRNLCPCGIDRCQSEQEGEGSIQRKDGGCRGSREHSGDTVELWGVGGLNKSGGYAEPGLGPGVREDLGNGTHGD